MQFCIVAEDLVGRLDALSRIFRYEVTDCAYTVDFTLKTVDETNMILCMNSFFMKRNERWDKRLAKTGAHKGEVILRELRRRWINAKKSVVHAYYYVVNFFYRNKSKNILLLSEVGTSLHGNLAVIYDRIKERGIDKEFNVEVSCREVIGTKNSKVAWLTEARRIAKAGLIIVDNYVPLLSQLKLDKKTRLVQVWHAGAGFKGVGYMRFGKGGSPFPAESVHKKYAVALAPSESLIKVFEEVFGIEKEAFLPVGMPRLDDYLDPLKIESFKNEFYEKYPELAKKKLILFAPTYRGNGQGTAYYDYSKIDFKRLYEFCGDEYVMLLKMHPFIKNWDDEPGKSKPDLKPYAPRILDFTSFLNINELFYITDVLITDYSSAYYEFSLFKRPILFFTYDRLLYENVRGVYQSVKDSAPGKVCDNFQELLAALENKDFDLDKTVAFSEAQFPHEPKGATDALLDKLLYSNE